jgi:uncharacterized protein (DUF1800 family)
MDKTLRALNRFGLGARIGERRTLGDPKEWLRAQARGAAPLADEIVGLDEITEALTSLRDAQRARDQTRLQAIQGQIASIREREMGDMLRRRVSTAQPYLERLVAFWSNHLCVSLTASRQVVALAGHYERTAIRPHVLGRFEDMVLASARHPAMLFYLNNLVSIGPRSPAGRRTARQDRPRGLNENYARELLELHTVGVEGGYGQTDVEQLARVLTGWTVSGVGPLAASGDRVEFSFNAVLHEPGEKTVMGRRYPEAGVREGEQVIRDLCAHPSTAAFVAKKLVAHFVADDPPEGAVARIAEVFLRTQGDLREVSLALVDLDEAWAPEHLKFRSPQDWVVALFRSLGSREIPPGVGRVLNQLRHTPWAPAAPKGYGDRRREWADPDALMNRAEFAQSVSVRLAQGRGFDPSALLDVVDTGEDDPIRHFLTDPTISKQERMALAFSGPAFQWR